MNSRALALLGLVAAAAVSASSLPELDQILNKHLEALGGKAAVDGIRSRVMNGCYIPTFETPCVPFDVYAKSGNRWKTVMTSPGILRLERMAAADDGWEQMSDRHEKMKPEARHDTSVAFSFSILHDLRAHFPTMTVARASDTAYEVEAKTASGQSTSIHFDKETGLVSRIGDFRLKDYRKADGVMAPTTIEHAKSSTRYVFPYIRNNVEIPDGAFHPETNQAPHNVGKNAMRKAALEEALRGTDISPQEKAALESLEFFSPHEGRILFDLIRQRGYKQAVEIGTAWGNSAIWMAMALKRNGGKLTTIELRPEYAKRAQENFAKAGLASAVESRVNDALKELPALTGEWDLVFMDTGTNLHPKFLALVRDRVRAGGAIISHNADTFERDQPDFRRAVMEDPVFETSLMLTPGGGMSVSIVRPRG